MDPLNKLARAASAEEIRLSYQEKERKVEDEKPPAGCGDREIHSRDYSTESPIKLCGD